MSLCHFCDYYVIIITFKCRFNTRPNFFFFICSGYASFVLNVVSSLAVIFFLRPFLWNILAFRIVETVCKPFTLFLSKWETKLRYQGQLNHPTPGITKKMIMLYFIPCALGAHASDDLSVFEKKEDMLFIHFILILCHCSLAYLTKTSLHKQAYISIFIHYCVCCNTYGTGGYLCDTCCVFAKRRTWQVGGCANY